MTMMKYGRSIAALGVAVLVSGCAATQGPVAYAPAPPPAYAGPAYAPAPIRVEPRRYYRPGFGYYGPGYATGYPYDPFFATGSLGFAYFVGRSYRRNDRDDHKGHRKDRRRDDDKAKRRGRDLSEEERTARRARRAQRRAAREAAGEPVRERAEGGDRNRAERRQRRSGERAGATGERPKCGRRGKRCGK